jgi:hypothetical protein
MKDTTSIKINVIFVIQIVQLAINLALFVQVASLIIIYRQTIVVFLVHKIVQHVKIQVVMVVRLVQK